MKLFYIALLVLLFYILARLSIPYVMPLIDSLRGCQEGPS